MWRISKQQQKTFIQRLTSLNLKQVQEVQLKLDTFSQDLYWWNNYKQIRLKASRKLFPSFKAQHKQRYFDWHRKSKTVFYCIYYMILHYHYVLPYEKLNSRMWHNGIWLVWFTAHCSVLSFYRARQRFLRKKILMNRIRTQHKRNMWEISNWAGRCWLIYLQRSTW